jgi:hypothetical protein
MNKIDKEIRDAIDREIRLLNEAIARPIVNVNLTPLQREIFMKRWRKAVGNKIPLTASRAADEAGR